MPEWWNGLHNGLKIRHSFEFAGSNPASGTNQWDCSSTVEREAYTLWKRQISARFRFES